MKQTNSLLARATSFAGGIVLLATAFYAVPAYATTFTYVSGTDASLDATWGGGSGSVAAAQGDTFVINTGSATIDFPATFTTSSLRLALLTGFTGTVQMTTTSIDFTSSTVQAGTLNTLTSTINISGALDITGGTVNSSAGTINITVPATGKMDLIGGAFLAGTFSSVGNLTISNGATWTSSTSNVTFSGTSKVITDNTVGPNTSKQDLGPVVITGTISTATSTRMTSLNISGGTLDISGDPLVLSGTGTVLTNTGTLTEDATSKVVLSSGGAATIPARTYGAGLELAGTGTYTLSSDATVSGDFTFISAGTMNIATTKTLTVSGTYTNSNGTVTLTGTGKIANANTFSKITNSAGTEIASFDAGTDNVFLRVVDPDRNLNASAIDTITVTLTTTSKFVDTETVTLRETGNATGIFLGSIGMRPSGKTATNSGFAEVSGNGTLSMAFVDAADSTDTGTDTANLTAGTPKVYVMPYNMSLKINNGDAQTTSNTVLLTMAAASASQMLVSNNPNFTNSLWEPYATSKTWTLSSGSGTKTVYIKFESSDGSRADGPAATITVVAPTPAATPVVEPTSPAPEPTTPAPTESTPAPTTKAFTPVSDGTLIKVNGSSAVYYVKAGKRYVFPMSKVYNTWYKDFSSVKTISSGDLSSYSLGGMVKTKPGALMIKLQTDPKVYYVGANGVLHWLKTEAVAKGIYGSAWAKKVMDMPDSFFPSYTIGEPIEDASAVTSVTDATPAD